ncbi:L-histidine N(alpha)-methyltransferase, partial [Streptomyces sp. NPDC007094]|uniref:L-histidine N(alpha)-methyltransferase n=1 Tax=Streptomyces sp. NPDC007094 TaxID=3155359 RepID=UPI0033CE8F89
MRGASRWLRLRLRLRLRSRSRLRPGSAQPCSRPASARLGPSASGPPRLGSALVPTPPPASARPGPTSPWSCPDLAPAPLPTPALRADVLSGLTRHPKTLPPKWFYDARGSELF